MIDYSVTIDRATNYTGSYLKVNRVVYDPSFSKHKYAEVTGIMQSSRWSLPIVYRRFPGMNDQISSTFNTPNHIDKSLKRKKKLKNHAILDSHYINKLCE